MNFFASFFWVTVGSLPPTLCGWLLLAALEDRLPVLWQAERIAMGFVLGATGSMFVTFILHITLHLSLSLAGFLVSYAVLAIPLGILFSLRQDRHPAIAPAAPSRRLSTTFKVILCILLAWSAVKVLSMGFLLFTTPSFFDDTTKNWDYRGKIFYAEQAIVLTLPPDTSPSGISSYPPAVSMLKTWLADLQGTWNEGTVNGVHILWYAALLLLTYCTLRRSLSRFWSLLGIYGLISLPLLLVHGTNAYADLFMAVHSFIAVILLYHAYRSSCAATSLTFLRLAALATAVIPFTKNEGLLLYLPSLAVLTAFILWRQRRSGLLTMRQVIVACCWFIGLLAIVAIPWITYKELNGLTFGNGKTLSSFQFVWQPDAILAIAVNTLLEANWLFFFPLFGCLLLLRPQKAFRSPLVIFTVFFLLCYAGQLALYLFTGLGAEAVRQTGYARGIIQILPAAIVVAVMLLQNIFSAQSGVSEQ